MNTTLFQIYLKFIWPKRQECERKHTLVKISQVRIFDRKFIRHIVQDRL